MSYDHHHPQLIKSQEKGPVENHVHGQEEKCHLLPLSLPKMRIHPERTTLSA